MARYTDSVCSLCRSEGVKLFLKGSRCYTTKCAIERRRYPTGQHGQDRKKQSEYEVQLREKQKVRRLYTWCSSAHFATYMEEAAAAEESTDRSQASAASGVPPGQPSLSLRHDSFAQTIAPD